MQFSIAQLLRATVWVVLAMTSYRFGGPFGCMIAIVFLAVADFFAYQAYANWFSLRRDEKAMALFTASVSVCSLVVYIFGLMFRGQ